MANNIPNLYPLALKSLPELGVEHHIDDLIKIRDFIEEQGVSTKNTRISRYINYLTKLHIKKTPNGNGAFKNSTGAPFNSHIDWHLYVLREVHELMWIVRGLQSRVPMGLDSKIDSLISGADFATLDKNTIFRNIQFELRIASYFCQAGYHVDLTSETDIVAYNNDYSFYVECKRVAKLDQLKRRISEASAQLRRRMPSDFRGKSVYGVIAVDVTKVAFKHNGLTIGMTPSHSRDIIQDKLIDIYNRISEAFDFKDNHPLQYWLQIHIPNLVLQPKTFSTRFSNYGINNNVIAQCAPEVLKELIRIQAIANIPDQRETPARTLTPRKTFEFPAGTKFWVDETLVEEISNNRSPADREQEEAIAELILNGTKHTFSYFDFKMISSKIILNHKLKNSINLEQLRVEIIVQMYAFRFPYEDDL